MNEPVAVLDQVSYLYPQSTQPVLLDVSFTIQKGELLGIIGPTGAGKSTLCLAFNGIVPQFYGGRFFGSIQVAGYDTLEHPVSELARRVGMVFEDPETQLLATSVETEIAFPLENMSVPREEIRSRIAWALELTRLEGLEKKHPLELSGGQKQRLAMAPALAMKPELLVLDEPTSQLDPLGSREVFAVVRDLNRELGISVLLVSHASEELAEFCNRIGLLSQGKMELVGPPDEIFNQVAILERNGLRPPQVTQTFYLLGKKGIHLPGLPVAMDKGLPLLDRLADRCTVKPPDFPDAQPVRERTPVLSARNVGYCYPDGTQALNGITLDIFQNEFVLIVGQNGAGKTTLVKQFLNLLQPSTGTIQFGGMEDRGLKPGDWLPKVGYLSQNPDNQIFNATVEEEVAFALKNLNYPREEVRHKTQAAMQAMEISEYRQSHPLALPKGVRARVVIAAVLTTQPELLIFDEPTTGQDFHGARRILEVCRELHQHGKTIIVITHQLHLMPEYAGRAIVMGKGAIMLDAPIRQVYHQVELLRSTSLVPPQAVLLAQALARKKACSFPLLTPEEVADCFSPCPYEELV